MPKYASNDEIWHAYLTGQAKAFMRYRYIFRLLPAQQRCKICEAPLDGLGGRLVRIAGIRSWGLSPRLCNACEIFAEKWPGGAEVDMAMLFADVRGSTTLAETMDTTEYSLLIRRFFSAGANILNKSDAVLDKLMGDQVSGYYLPAFAGNNYCRKAFQSGLDLLRAVGYGSAEGPWLQIGVGVHTGRAYMGSVSTESGHNDITALGDQVNVAARLASSAAPGELVMSCVLYEAADMDLGPLERREFSVKGRQEAIPVYVLRVD